MTWNPQAAQHLRDARLALIDGGLGGRDHDRTIAAYNTLMVLCQTHELVAGEPVVEPVRRLQGVA